MRILLVSDNATAINFFPMLEGILRKKVAGVEVRQVFVPFPEDIPAAIAREQKDASLVFVFVLFEEMDFKTELLLSKLIDLEMKGGARIVKAIEENWLGGMDPARLEQEKDALAEKWAEFILDCLFRQEKFSEKK